MAKAGSLYKQKKSPYWWAKFYVPGQKEPIRESTKTTDEEEAQRYLWRRLGEIATGKFNGLAPERLKVSELFDYLEEEYLRVGNRSWRATEIRLRLHLRPFFGNMLAAELGTRQINNYIALRRKAPAVNKHSKRKSQAQKPASNATINRELELLRRAINLGYRAEPQLVTKPVHVPMLPENNVREGILEHHEYVRLRDSLPAHYQLLLVCGYHLGTRLGELIKLRWEHVDLDRKEILIIADNSKTKKARVIPIYGEMEVFLRMAWERRNTEAPTCPWVMRVKERRMSFSWHGWQGYIAAVGLPDLLFHDLRRTAVTNMLDAGFTEKEAMSISGHTTNSMIKRYQIIRRGKMQSLGAKLAEYYSAKNEGLVSASKTV